MTLSQARLNEYWAIIDEIDRMSKADLLALWNSFDVDDRAELWSAFEVYLPEIVGEYRALAAQAAMTFYEETQGVTADSAVLAAVSQVEVERLNASVRYALFGMKGDPLAKVSGIVTQHVVDGGRDYAIQSFDEGGNVWVRAARPGACAFCRMLATRAVTSDGYTGYGTLYTKAASSVMVGGAWRDSRTKRPEGSKFHDHCKCLPVKKSEYQIPQHVHDWADEYYVAVDEAGSYDLNDVVAEMRKISGNRH